MLTCHISYKLSALKVRIIWHMRKQMGKKLAVCNKNIYKTAQKACEMQ